MTSNVNYTSINENFPVPGEDNDTQVFRDNFDTIKNSLRAAQEEITDLQENSARTDNDNDFQGNIISNAVLDRVDARRHPKAFINADTAQYTIDYEYGGYQPVQFEANMSVIFQNFPNNATAVSDKGVGKVTLELYGDGSTRTITFLTSEGLAIRAKNWPESGPFINVTSATEPVIIEVWKHSPDYIFMNYLGQFTAL